VKDVRQRRQTPAQVVDRSYVIRRHRAAVWVIDHRLDGGLVLPGKIVHKNVVTLARLITWRQLIDVTVGKAELQERCPGSKQDRQRRHQHEPRTAHHPDGHRVPRTSACGPAIAEKREPQAIDAGPDDR
jgi:hypothetical protein